MQDIKKATIEHSVILILTFLVVFCIGSYITYQSNYAKVSDHERYMRDALHNISHNVNKRFIRSIDSIFYLKNEIELHGPDNLVQNFDLYADFLIKKIDGISSLQLAPNGRTQYIYPLAGNEAVLGHRFKDDDPRHSALMEDYLNGKVFILGPFKLIQGGMGIVASTPVYYVHNSLKQPWGFATVVIKVEDFIKSTELDEMTSGKNLEYQLVIHDKWSGDNTRISSKHYPANTPDYFEQTIQVENSSWQIRLVDTAEFNPHSWFGYWISFFIALVFASVALRLAKEPSRLRRLVTERTEEINKQQCFQREMLDAIPMSLVVTNTDGDILFNNKRFLSTKLTMPKEDVASIFDTNFKEFNEHARELLMHKSNVSESVLTVNHHYSLELSLIRLNSCDSNEERYLWALKDVSSLQEMNQALHELSSQRANIFELIPEGLAYFDKDGVIRSFNSNFHQQIVTLTGSGDMTTVSDLESRLHNTAVVNGQKVDFTLKSNNKFDDGSGHMTSQVIHSLNEKNKLYKKTVKFDSMGRGGLILIRDVTEQVQMDQIKSEFLSTAAHELRTPMANIFGYLELLLNKKIADEQKSGMLKIVYEEAERLSHILDDLLDLARIESKLSASLNYQQHDMKNLVEETLGDHSEYAINNKLKLSIDDALPPLMCDEVKIKQVIHNLLSNACKYSEPGTTISLTIKQAGDDKLPGILLLIKDRGIGMHEDEVARIFDRFYRANEHSEKSGTGLGMTIVKQIIELHNGEISVSSQFGKGTKVFVWLPLDRRK